MYEYIFFVFQISIFEVQFKKNQLEHIPSLETITTGSPTPGLEPNFFRKLPSIQNSKTSHLRYKKKDKIKSLVIHVSPSQPCAFPWMKEKKNV